MTKTGEVIEIPEWKTVVLQGVQLCPEDRAMAQSLERDGRHIQIEELRKGLRISTSSWVGVVRFREFEVRVLPKLAGDNLRLIEMIEFASGLDALRRSVGVRKLDAGGANLFDLIVLLLAEESLRIARSGFLSDYVEREGELEVVRGRLLADRQMLERFGQIDRLICRYDERDQNVPENQLLALALEHCARRASNHDVRRKVRQIAIVFREISNPREFELSVGREQFTYNRLNEHYRNAHELAWLVLASIGVRDVFDPGAAQSFAFLLDMNALFERFVYRVVSKLLTNLPYRVRYQAADRSIIWNAVTNRPYARVVPDLLIRRINANGGLALDAKYKSYDLRKVASSDIYQAFLYAFAYGGTRELLPATLIVYPTSSMVSQVERLRIRTSQHSVNSEVKVIGIHIPTMLDEFNEKRRAEMSNAILKCILEAMSDVDPECVS